MEEVNFEEAMKKLEILAQELEKGDLDLDQSVQKPERFQHIDIESFPDRSLKESSAFVDGIA